MFNICGGLFSWSIQSVPFSVVPLPDNNRGIYLIYGDTGKKAVERYGIFFVWAIFAANKRFPEFANKLLKLAAKLNHTPPMEITPADKFLWLAYSRKRYGKILKWLQS